MIVRSVAAGGCGVLALLTAGCAPESSGAPTDPEPTRATLSAPAWWDTTCPAVIQADQALQAVEDAEPGDQNWTNAEAGKAAASAGARADAYGGLAEQFSTGPVPEMEVVRPYFDLRAEEYRAISEAYRQLQQDLRDAPSPEAAEQVWRSREDDGGELAGAVAAFNAELETFVRQAGDDFERAVTEFGAPLESRPDCSAAWHDLP